MPQSLTRIGVHLVFSTKHREPLITPEVRPALFAYLAGTLNAIDCPAIEVGGAADHVHLLFVLSNTVALSRAVEEVKKESSKWAKGNVHPRFYWQGGYGAFAVSASNEPQVIAYIQNQEEHHRKMTFQDEVRALMQKRGSPLDERYFWD
ncbi:transposase [Frigoriglobus tundricola]|uniref:Putative transposase n=1 Tax=Frigoriglobus tundricola TaxID=2774151 RepID=A0A6M5YNG5_9BACT|nr:transposase [Frigoriglobus tundricola]QJW95515.1 putative transposase [Frigoriglobus tundricola]